MTGLTQTCLQTANGGGSAKALGLYTQPLIKSDFVTQEVGIYRFVSGYWLHSVPHLPCLRILVSIGLAISF